MVGLGFEPNFSVSKELDVYTRQPPSTVFVFQQLRHCHGHVSLSLSSIKLAVS